MGRESKARHERPPKWASPLDPSEELGKEEEREGDKEDEQCVRPCLL